MPEFPFIELLVGTLVNELGRTFGGSGEAAVMVVVGGELGADFEDLAPRTFSRKEPPVVFFERIDLGGLGNPGFPCGGVEDEEEDTGSSAFTSSSCVLELDKHDFKGDMLIDVSELPSFNEASLLPGESPSPSLSMA